MTKYLGYVELGVVFVLVSVIILSIFAQVLSRYVFKISISWLEELARFTFIWAALYGGSIAYRKGVLHKFEIAYGAISPRIPQVLGIVTRIAILFFLGVLIIYGFKLSFFVYNQFSPALTIRMTYVYLAVPVAAVMMFISTVLDISRV
ncbi:MAG: TRAP transporter small permease, partial [Spirochaetales bacterium]|nr:TRAP transporter small permease [Spirochaetales bacterium]